MTSVYDISGVERNENFKKLDSLLVWADEDGKYKYGRHGVLAQPEEGVVAWDLGEDSPSDCLGLRAENISYSQRQEVYSYVQVKVTGRVPRSIPHYCTNGLKVKVTFVEEGTVRDGFVTNWEALER